MSVTMWGDSGRPRRRPPPLLKHAALPGDLAEPTSFGDIVVTAQKRVERLRNTPVPVTALDGRELVERNQTRLQDYFLRVPGLELISQGDGTALIVIRGITSGNFSNPTTAVLIDDVPVGSSTALAGGQLLQPDLDPSDLARVEVLRGPQGTLYGAASLGGLVKYVTADPLPGKIDGRVQAEVGAVSHGGIGDGLRIGLDLPLSDTLAAHAGGFVRRTAGFIDNVESGQSDVNAINAVGGRLALVWRPSNGLSVKLGAFRQSVHGYGGTTVTTDYRQQPTVGDLAQAVLPASGAYRTTTNLLTANVDLALGWSNFKSITGYSLNSYSSASDASNLLTSYAPSTLLGNTMRTTKFTQELRLSSLDGAPAEWLIGGFYTRERSSTVQTIDAVEPVTGTLVANLLTANFPTRYTEVAVFGDIVVHPTARLSLQGGVRYSHNHQDYREIDSGPRSEMAQGTPYLVSSSSADQAVTFLFTPQFRFSDHLMAYARFATGYRPGGPNGLSSFLDLPKTFGADTTLNYEVGFKGDLMGRRLNYEISVYDIEWRSIQLRAIDPSSQFSYFVNGGHARSDGVELAVDWHPGAGLRLSASGSYALARFVENPPTGIFAHAGDRLPYSPRLSGTLSIDRDFALGGGWTGSLGGSIAYAGQRWGVFPRNAQSLRVSLQPYATLDLRLGARRGSWSVNLFGRNVADQRGALNVAATSRTLLTTGSYNTTVIQPRTVGLSVARNF